MLEKDLQDALKEANDRVEYWKKQVADLQGAMVLQQIYSRRVRQQLQMKEAKGEKKSNRVLKDPGLGRVITDDEFYLAVKAQKEADERQKPSGR